MNSKKLTFRETQEDLQQKLFLLDKNHAEEKFDLVDIADFLPVGLLINHRNGTNTYMNKVSQDILRYNTEELRELGPDYTKKVVYDKAELERITLLHEEFFKRNDKNEIYSNFQRLRPKGEDDYRWIYVTSKIFRWDDEGTPVERLLVSAPVSFMGNMADKIDRVLDDNIYLKKNFKKFSLLTKREKEVLGLLTKGFTAKTIADELFISKHTVEQHRKNIRYKLEIRSLAALIKFAETFGL